ncbi:MAG TPA: sugar transferase [Thermomicrobiales bacterium]|nr:sugar transferase [Thermomicrobiales bacterium]
MTYLPANARVRTMPAVRPARAPAILGPLSALTVDLLAIWLSFWLAYQLRYVYEVGGQVYEFNQRSFADFHNPIALFTLLCLGIFLVRGVYRLSSWTALLDEMGLVAGSVTMAMGGLLLTAYLSQFSPSRLFFVYAWAILLGSLFFVRVARRQMREALWARDIGVRRVLIVGNGTTGRRLMQMLLATPGMGMRVSGYVDEGLGRKSLTAGSKRGVIRAQHLGSLEDIPSILDRNQVDEVILALPSEGHGRTLDIASWCRSAGVPFRVVPDLLQLSLDRVQLDEISGVPILSVREASIRGTNAAIKRGMDVLGTLVLLVVLALPMAIGALATHRATGGPILMRRKMVGRCGVPFTQLRFASPPPLEHDASSSSWMHRCHLDGAPQLLNVLRADMSLIGPRAQPADRTAHYQDWQRQRLLIAPGMTGLWFSNGRTDLTFDEMVRLDLFYAEHWSAWLDSKILLRTMVALLRGRPGS